MEIVLALAGILLVLVLLGWKAVSHGSALAVAQDEIASAHSRLDQLERSVSISGLAPPYARPTMQTVPPPEAKKTKQPAKA